MRFLGTCPPPHTGILDKDPRLWDLLTLLCLSGYMGRQAKATCVLRPYYSTAPFHLDTENSWYAELLW